MEKHNCFSLVFSGSCAIYGNADIMPITEESPIGDVKNVYGRTKYFIEEILMDLSRSSEVSIHVQMSLAFYSNGWQSQSWSIISLRFFNPIGAHSSGRIGDYSDREDKSFMLNIGQVALGNDRDLPIKGIDFNTDDGSGKDISLEVTV